jgi:dienelactone hydrolase
VVGWSPGSGPDVTKEILYGIIRDELADRGIACLVVDTPGVGEPLRLRGVPSRPDYEVPTTAIVDYLQARPDIDPARIGLLGISLGGYHAPRGAACEHRITAGSADKTLRIFSIAEGGTEHVNADDPDPARQLIADWFADRLGTIPAHR